jgi:L-alanine-DL-glutamate epimerase-like enolase superfamily enzyme
MKTKRRDFLKTSLSAFALTGIDANFQLTNKIKNNFFSNDLMKLSYKKFDLKLKHTFTISRSSRDVVPIILTQLNHDGIIGYGESSPNVRYHEDSDSVIKFLDKLDLTRFKEPFEYNAIFEYIDNLTNADPSAKASIDIAIYDWIGKKLNIPLYKMWGLDKNKTPYTSYTIGIDKPEVVEQKVREVEEFPILKIKVGTDSDKEMMDTIRKVTKKPIRVDANEGWKSKELAFERIKWLQGEGVEFIEQPMPAAQIDDIKWLRDKIDFPIIADEAVTKVSDIPILATAYDGINIKLQKCNGIHNAIKMITLARSLNMKIMMGCMIESNVGISAAAHLSPLIDYADLDGNILINNDPFDGVTFEKGKIILNDRPGLGVVPK